MRNSTRTEAAGLRLVACTLAHAKAELDAPETLAEMLGVGPLSRHWPPGEYDRDAQRYFRELLREGGAAAVGWYGWYAILAGQAVKPRQTVDPTQTMRASHTAPCGSSGQAVLVGACGFFGPPDATGGVAIGYSVLPQWSGQGLATRMAALLVEHALAFPAVTHITAETTHANIASQKVLRKVGFQLQATGPNADMLRYILRRSV